jgi:hypothetical protein
MVNVAGDVWTAGFFIEVGARDVAWNATRYGYVNFDTPEVRRLLHLQHRIGRYTVWSNYGNPAIAAMLEPVWWWEQALFPNNQVLANNFGGWMYTEFADPGHWMHMPGQWDMFPIPGSNEMGPSVSTVFDPVVIRNFAGQDNADLQLDITYAFAAFMYGSLEGMRARNPAGIELQDEYGNLFFQTATNSSWPVVRAPYFDQQMEIWYDHHPAIFREMAGFQNLLRLFREGQFWNRDARTFPQHYVQDGVIRNAFAEWYNREDESVAGVPFSDPAWPDRVIARLGEWTELTNARLELANQSIRDALTRHYGITDF